MNSTVLALAFLVASISVSAQADSSASKPAFFFVLHYGGLLGERGHGVSLTSSFELGVRYKRMSFAAGIGYDSYPEWRILPVFGSIGTDIIRKKDRAWFMAVESGYAKAWNPTIGEEQVIYGQEKGFFVHPLAGYRITRDKLTVCLSAGYKIQMLGYVMTPRWMGGNSKTTVELIMERLSVRLGIGFR